MHAQSTTTHALSTVTRACPGIHPHLSIPADEEARARGTQKSVLERKGPPTFPLVLEMRDRDMWVAHWVEDSVDALLQSKCPVVQVRG